MLPEDPDALVASTVRLLLAGHDDFDRHASRLRDVRGMAPNHVPAQVFLPIVEFLAFARRTLMDPDPARGKLRDLLNRSGFHDANPQPRFWAVMFEEENHNQGDIKNSTPSLDVWLAFLTDELRPALVDLERGLGATPKTFAYRVPTRDRGRLGTLFADALDVEIDYGDVIMLRGAARAVIAQIDVVSAYDHAKLLPNDFDELEFPTVDPLALIETKYTALGNMVAGWQPLLTRARLLARDAFNDYDAAAQHIRGESPAQQAIGLLTIGPRSFPNAADRALFLQEELSARAWARNIVNASFSNQPYTITTDSKGKPIPVGDRPTIRFFQFWNSGLQVRSVFLRTIVDPFDNRRTFGVTSLAQITSPMFTIGSIVDKWNGVAPTAGDMQDDSYLGLYAMRVDNPPTSTKTIDGNSADWATGKAQLAASPVAGMKSPHPDLGNVWVAHDANHVYLLIDKNLGTYTINPYDSYEIYVESQTGYAGVGYRPQGGPWQYSSNPSTPPVWKTGTGGVEIAVPKANFGSDAFVAIEVIVETDNATYRIESSRSGLFVKVR